jgi:peptidoglycan/LPS O-acetylase OafA/YrhL
VHLTPPPYRPDIDGLRGIAVLAVVAYHASPLLAHGGFIGVDIFFVISGFLISSIILGSLERGTFTFREFYSRRVRRLFPALSTVLFACLAFGWFALLSVEYTQLGKHLAAGAAFVSNFAFWREAGYFDAGGETKPLLHLWSLGVEEQFYIVWPLLLWTSWRVRVRPVGMIVLLVLASFALNLLMNRTDPAGDFYSPQTRFWELLAGAWLAHVSRHGSRLWARVDRAAQAAVSAVASMWPARFGVPSAADIQSIAGALAIAASFVLIRGQSRFPGPWALLPVAGTLLLIAAGPQAWFNRAVLADRRLVWFGLVSFPLYLWHWPLLSFATIVEGAAPGRSIRFTAVFLSVVLAWATYRFVERPIRFGQPRAAKVFLLIAAMAAIGVAGYAVYQRDGLPQARPIRSLEASLGDLEWPMPERQSVCGKYFPEWRRYIYCKLAADAPPTVALMGDSFADAYFYGLASELGKRGDTLAMIGGYSCPPLLDVTSGWRGHPDWCDNRNTIALKEVAANPGIHTVILAGNWHFYINGTRLHQQYDDPWELRLPNSTLDDNAQVFIRQMRETIRFLADHGKHVVVMKQSPEIDVDPKACLVKRPLTFQRRNSRCDLTSAEAKAYLSEYEPTFDEATRGADAQIVDPFPILCPGERCLIMDGLRPVYRDALHLSLYGSSYLASRLHLTLSPGAS